jgi:putative heme-binding domain-containing protein
MRFLPFSCLFVSSVFNSIACAAADDAAQRAKDAVVARALLRLPGIDLTSKPDAKAAVLRHLQSIQGTDQYLELADKFTLRELKNDILQLAFDHVGSTRGVKAAGLLVKWDERDLLAKAIADSDPTKAAQIIGVLGLLADAKTNDLLIPLITDSELPLAVRSATVTALGHNAPGQKWLLATVESAKLPPDLQFAAANVLLASADESIRAAASKHLALPAGAGGESLPPVAELARRSGDEGRGKQLFAGAGSCAKCHKVRGDGKEVGPDLSEIGSKLSKEALYVSILDPNAGVSFNYETWVARTLDGTTLSGILVSQTDDAVELKTAEAIVHQLKRDDIEALKKLPTSLMPADLQKQLQAQDLVDLVEYLTTLKKQ